MSFFKNEKETDQIAMVKRFMEYVSMVPGFEQEYQVNPEATLSKYRIALTPYDLQCTIHKEDGIDYMRAVHPNGGMAYYTDFVERKLKWRDSLKDLCEPEQPAFKKWRARQIARCKGAFSTSRNLATVHEVLAFELTSGCSVGCPFCGLSAGKLTSIYRHTTEQAKLFRDILQICKKIIGNGTQIATCYYGTEPLDNPDYELFIQDYRDAFGHFPQMTSAAGARDVERLRRLIHGLSLSDENIYRLSVRSLEEFHLFMKEFTAKELLLVELLPQYEAAPRCQLEKVGRNRNTSEETDYGETISCVSGFLINMPNKTIKLLTPVPASKAFPNGQAVLFEDTFADAESFEEKLLAIIGQMKTILSPRETLCTYPYFHLEKSENGVKIQSESAYSIEVQNKNIVPIYEIAYNRISEGIYTRKEIGDELIAQFPQADPASIFSMINLLWNQGIIVDHQIYG